VVMVVLKGSRKREMFVYVRFGACLPTGMFTISIRLWKEPRRYDKRSVVSSF